MTDDQFSKAFKDIVPDSPSPDGWAAGALRKRRSRAGAVGGVVGVLAVALAIPVALNLPNSPMSANPADQAAEEAGVTSPPNPAEDAPDDSDGVAPEPAGTGLPGAEACYDSSGALVQPVEGEQIEPGATLAWLCGDASPENPTGTVGPLEPLMDGLDGIVEFVEAQEEPDIATIMCPADYALTYNVILEYPDGSRRAVSGELHGCRMVFDGTTYRAGGEEFYDYLRGLWLEQRDGTEAHMGGDGSTSCPVSNSMLVPTLDDIRGGVVCVPGADGASYGQAGLHPDDLDLIVADIRANAVEGEPTGWGPGIGLQGGWGDWLGLVGSDVDGSYHFYDAEGTSRVWTPSPEAAEVLAAVIDGAPVSSPPDIGGKDPEDPPVPPGEQPNFVPPFEPEGCVGVQAGELSTSELPGGVVPAAPEAVWLCGKGLDPAIAPAGPLEPLTGAAAQSAVDLYNALPLPDPNQACTEELGPSYFVVHSYADGTRLPVEIQDYGCRVVAAGADVRVDSMTYLDGLVGLWNEQREASGVPMERPAPICSATPSIIPVDLAGDFTAGYACRNLFDDGQGGERGEEALAPELLESVVELAAASSYPLPAEDPWPASTNDALVLLNQYGDPLQLMRMDDGTYQWLVGDQWIAWEPPSAVAVELDQLLAG